MLGMSVNILLKEGYWALVCMDYCSLLKRHTHTEIRFYKAGPNWFIGDEQDYELIKVSPISKKAAKEADKFEHIIKGELTPFTWYLDIPKEALR